MDQTEPSFLPECLNNSDDKSASKSLRIKSLDNDLGRPTSSSYSRNPYSSFGHRDRDNSKEKAENRFRDYSDSLANILPSWFEKDGVKRSHRSHSNVSAKRVELSPRKSAAEIVGHNNGKVPFHRDFPSLGSEEKQMDFEFVRVPSPVVVGDVWTSALADAPMVETNVTAGRNMAQTPPQLSVGSQRLEELAVKQSRQLIPMTPSMPKVLATSSSDKPKIKVGGQLQIQTSHIVSPRPVSVNADVTKTSPSSSSSTVGKFHILKLSRERSSTTPIAKETSSLPGGGKLPNSPLAVPMDRKAFTPEKRPSPQAKSRYEFFNLMRKKSMANKSSSSVSPDTRTGELSDDKPGKGGENNTKIGKNDFILYSEEEEARFLRSLGWEETTEEEEEGGLTEEEINSFYRDVSKYVNSRMGFKGTQPKCLMPIILQMGKNGGEVTPR